MASPSLSPNPWLGDSANQQTTLELARRTIEAIDPGQLPFLEGYFPRYVELAQKGPVVVSRRDRPFGFDAGGVFVEFVIAGVIQALQSLVVVFGPRIFHYLRGTSPDVSIQQLQPDFVRFTIQQALLAQNLATDLRLRIEDALTQAILLLIFPPPRGE